MFSVILCLSMLMGMGSVFATGVAVTPVDNEQIEARITNCPNCGWAINVTDTPMNNFKYEGTAQYQWHELLYTCGSCGWSSRSGKWVFVKYV